MPRAQVLESSHPLVRATQRFDRARVRLLCGLAFLAAAGLTAHGPARQAELGIAAVICAVLGVLVGAAWSNRRERALELIIAGREDLPLVELEPLRRRLHDPRRRALLASSLGRCVRSAERWDQIAPQFRPVANVRLLLPLQDDVIVIQRLLCADEVPRVRGVALCERLLTDGTTSPLYRNDPDALRRELGRIRFNLEAQ
jgi:hypothetical protein